MKLINRLTKGSTGPVRNAVKKAYKQASNIEKARLTKDYLKILEAR